MNSKPRNLGQLLWLAAGVLLGAIITEKFAGPFRLPLYAGIGAWFAELVLVASIGGSRTGARLAVFVTGLAFAIPFFVPANALGRFLLACLLALPCGGAVNLLLAPPIAGFRARLGFMGTWGMRSPGWRARKFDVAALLQLLAATVVLGAAIAVVKAVPASGAWLTVRWFAGGVAALAFGEMASAGPNLLMAALGINLPPLMRSPYLAASLTEFWSRRWNIAASQIFHRLIFVPLSRYGWGVAMFVVFAFSGLVHAFLAVLALGRWPISLYCGAFFVVQPIFIFLERRMNVRHWPRAAGHVWTLTVLAITCPLFIEPGLQIVEPAWGPPDRVVPPTLSVLGFVMVAGIILVGLPMFTPRQIYNAPPSLAGRENDSQ